MLRLGWRVDGAGNILSCHEKMSQPGDDEAKSDDVT